MKIGFIGCGKMGEAILESLIRSDFVVPSDILVSETDAGRLTEVERRHKVSVSAAYQQTLKCADGIFLAVKPQVLDHVLPQIAGTARPGCLFISIAAGKKLSGIEAALEGHKVVRVMPNLATLVAQGMSVFCAGRHVTDPERHLLVKMLGCFGKVLELPEDQFDAVTALSGSGPAFFAYYLQAICDGASDLGLDPENAWVLATQTMLGTANLLDRGRWDAEGLIAAVSSAKGTTVAGMAVLETSTIRETVSQTLRAAAQRSKELSSVEPIGPTG